jgi:ubiquinone/menaquinone biosynthesis C-methylase UbiE
MTETVDSSRYTQFGYDSKARFASYWHQVQEVISAGPETMLEVGVGNGFVSNYLAQRGFRVTTLDVDHELDPDVVARACEMPFANRSFDMVACYQVLEHLPFESLPEALQEIHRVSKLQAVLSLPDCTPTCGFEIRLPLVRKLQILLPCPRLRASTGEIDSQHLWEIGAAGSPLRAVRQRIRDAGFRIEHCYRVFENPYHRFFVLRTATLDGAGQPGGVGLEERSPA